MNTRKKSKEIAYDYLLEEIVSNRLGFGSPVIEQKIADVLHISRTPIREAIKQLEAENLVVCFPFQGTFVSSLPMGEIEEICGLRAAMESFALEKSIHLFSDEELDQLKEDFVHSFDDVAAYQHVDAVFHDMIVNKANYRRTIDLIHSLNIQIERFRNASRGQFQSRGDASLKEHLELIELIRQRDLDAAKVKLKQHLMNVRNFFETSAVYMK